jgi:hypothetical protein
MKISKAGDASSIFDEAISKMAKTATEALSEDQATQMNMLIEPATQKLREILVQKIQRSKQQGWTPQSMQQRLFWRDIVENVAGQIAPISNPKTQPLQRGLQQVLEEKAPAIVGEIIAQTQRQQPGQQQPGQQQPGQQQPGSSSLASSSRNSEVMAGRIY